ncbi:hypothetical protein F4818DRAFT_151648 [Hypoxylon cercidicola]|nr:hypothetical protein F4818DRAFT_151648 [Hypoxylon cercidicola]
MASLDKANLKRIRDNQRRSRARRRQYIQELEMQIEYHRSHGVEATAEVQRAARRVAEQNKKMRVLLNSLGFNNEEIGYFLRTDNHRDPETIAGENLFNNQEGAAEALEILLMTHRSASHDSGPYLSSPSTPSAVLDNGISNGIAGLLSETHAAEPIQQVQLPNNPTFPTPSIVDLSTQESPLSLGFRMSPGEGIQHSPGLVELSGEQQLVKEFCGEGSARQDDISYGYDVNDEDAMSHLSLPFTPERTGPVSTGSMELCNSQRQSYNQFGYASMVPCAYGNVDDDASPFGVSLHSGSRVSVWV